MTSRRPYARKAQKYSTQLSKNTSRVAEKKKGTIAGAVALVIGTSIGSGILALPEKASPAVLPLFFSLSCKRTTFELFIFLMLNCPKPFCIIAGISTKFYIIDSMLGFSPH